MKNWSILPYAGYYTFIYLFVFLEYNTESTIINQICKFPFQAVKKDLDPDRCESCYGAETADKK